jgi:nitrogen fixation/metabolism regulation signal transduction histidine kinase
MEIKRDIRLAVGSILAFQVMIAFGTIALLERMNPAVIRSEDEARRLGTAGVWVIVLLGFFGFLVGIVAMRRLHLRIVRPVAELCGAITAWRQGDHLRRCELLGSPQELRNAMQLINDLMDEHTAPALPERQETRNRERAVLLHLLEREPEPAVIVDYYGNIAAANNRAIRLLSGPNGDALKDQIALVPMGQSGEGLIEITAIRGIHWWQVRLRERAA